MTRTIKLTFRILHPFIVGFFILMSCTKDNTDPDPDPKKIDDDTTQVEEPKEIDEPGDESNYDANTIQSGFIFNNVSAIQGKIPTSASQEDLKLDRETLYLAEGIKNRVQILYPSGAFSGFSAVYIQVAGADEYLDVMPDETESSDTIGVIYIEFDPGDMELPLSFDIKIVPHDDGGNPIDPFEREVVVEKKGDDACTPAGPSGVGNWFWLWTVFGDYYAAPGLPVGTVASTNGCCIEGFSVDCIANAIPEEEWISLDYAAYLMTNLEYISFSDDGTMAGQLIEQTQNLDYSESDFCTGEAAYVRNTSENFFWGEYEYLPAQRQVIFNTIESTQREICFEELGGFCVDVFDKFYITGEAHYEILSCHFMIETSFVEGQKRDRLFERREGEVDAAEYAYWYD